MGGGSSDDVILPPMENTVLGVCAGTIEVTLLQPMLYCKNASQQGLPLTLDPRALYRGLGVSVINMSILTGVQFPLTGLVAQAIAGGADRTLSASEKIASGFVGGVLSGLICAPMELVMIQQQRFGASLLGTAGKIVSDLGPLALFRGLSTSCGREGIFTAGCAPTAHRQSVAVSVLVHLAATWVVSEAWCFLPRPARVGRDLTRCWLLAGT